MNDVYFRVVAEPLVSSGRNSAKIKDRLSNDRIPQLKASVSPSRVSKVYLYDCYQNFKLEEYWLTILKQLCIFHHHPFPLSPTSGVTLIESMMGLRPRQGNLRLVFQIV